MRRNLTYLTLLIVLIFGCENQIPPNGSNLQTILDSNSFELIIKGCHGGMMGGVDCEEEIIIFDKDTLKFKSQDKTYIRVLNDFRRDTLYKCFHDLLKFHQPDKNIEKDGGGCMYHDYDYTFINDSLKLTIKPAEGNGIYYRIQDIITLNLLADIINWAEEIHQLDSLDFLKFKHHKITNIKKLVSIEDGIEIIVGLHLKTTLSDSSITIIPIPNPGYSFKKLSPVTFVQRDNEFYDFIVLPERYIEDIDESDTLLNSILELDILGVDFELLPAEDILNKSSRDLYGIKSKDRYIMKLKFADDKYLNIKIEDLSLDIYQ